MKIAIIFSYDGSRFLGSQSQPHKQSVEDELKKALAHVGIYDAPIMSSRTDKGVHALRQCASVRVGACWQNREAKLTKELQKHLPNTINISRIYEVKDDFHARYDATARSYRYIITHSAPTPFEAKYLTYALKFDTKRADELLAIFRGSHDFSAFMKVGSDTKTSTRNIIKTRCYTHKGKSIIMLRANGFLRSQVRLIVAAVLKALSLEKGKDKQALKDQLSGKKMLTRMPAPATGLYLARVHYF